MSQVRRIYAEKRPGYDVAARQLCDELREALGTDAISRVRIFQRYDVEGLSDETFDCARGIIFSEPNADVLYDETLPQMDAHLLAVEYLPGQYDQRADSAASVCSCSVRSRRARRLPAPRCMPLKAAM